QPLVVLPAQRHVQSLAHANHSASISHDALRRFQRHPAFLLHKYPWQIYSAERMDSLSAEQTNPEGNLRLESAAFSPALPHSESNSIVPMYMDVLDFQTNQTRFRSRPSCRRT